MENTVLSNKLDTLGQMMWDWKQMQEAFEAEHADLLKSIADLREEVKADVLQLGHTAETLKLRAELRHGAARWDTRFLEGYVLNHPELMQYKHEGRDTVAFILKED